MSSDDERDRAGAAARGCREGRPRTAACTSSRRRPWRSRARRPQPPRGPSSRRPPSSVTDQVSEPAKVMRIATMIRQLLDEVKSAPLDEASRQRMGSIYTTSIGELKEGLPPPRRRARRLSLPFSVDVAPSDAELRIAQAQLVGWLEGLFHGIQTALFAQQMAARAQLEQMRRALPPGERPQGPQPGPSPAAPAGCTCRSASGRRDARSTACRGARGRPRQILMNLRQQGHPDVYDANHQRRRL